MNFQGILTDWLFATVMSFIGVFAFSVIFHIPRKQYLFAGFTGSLAWLVYTISITFNPSIVFASFLAAIFLTAISRILSFLRKEPITTFLICGVFPIVPGAGIYYTGYYLFMGENSLGASKGFETLKIAIAIALGIGIVLSLPSFLFDYRKKEKVEENS